MSYTVEISIAYKGTLIEIKKVLEETLGISLPHSEYDEKQGLKAFYGSLITIDLQLSINYLESDRNLNFSDFTYLLTARTGASHNFRQRLLELQIPVVDTIGLLLCYHLNTDVMVTVNVQTLHAKYSPEQVKSAFLLTP